MDTLSPADLQSHRMGGGLRHMLQKKAPLVNARIGDGIKIHKERSSKIF
jgi:hypothetical protein